MIIYMNMTNGDKTMTYEELNDLKKRVTLLENLRKLRVLCGGIYEIESSVKGLAR